jgi:hypothetical protein
VGLGCVLIAAFALPWMHFYADSAPLLADDIGWASYDFIGLTEGHLAWSADAAAQLANVGAGAVLLLAVYGLVWSRRWIVGLVMASFLVAGIGAGGLVPYLTYDKNVPYLVTQRPMFGAWIFLGVAGAGVLLAAFDFLRWGSGTIPSRSIAASPNTQLLGIGGASIGVAAAVAFRAYSSSEWWHLSPDFLGGLLVGVLVFFGLVGLVLAARALRSPASAGGEPPTRPG